MEELEGFSYELFGIYERIEIVEIAAPISIAGFNHEERMVKIINQIKKLMDENSFRYRILYLDNGVSSIILYESSIEDLYGIIPIKIRPATSFLFRLESSTKDWCFFNWDEASGIFVSGIFVSDKVETQTKLMRNGIYGIYGSPIGKFLLF